MEQRIAAVTQPYEHDVGEQLARMMPPGVEAIALFRTFVRNMPMTKAMHGWGSYELGRELSLSMRERETVIVRTCARCGCEYEWGVHIAFFAERAGFTPEQVRSLTHGETSDRCWTDRRDALLLAAVDSLHDSNDIDDALWRDLVAVFTEVQLLDLLMLCVWYHAISFSARAARVALEPGAPRFADVR